jgi:formylmethanofuran dehydrogenase subunit C
MSLHFEPITATHVPLEVPGLLPEALRERTLAEIERWPLWHGNRREPLGEFFRVSGSGADERLEFSGDLSGVHRLGANMSRGTIHVEGPAGRHLGAEMRGGTIEVTGPTGDWLGAEMHGGLIRVGGDAGNLVGAAYRGSMRGMTGGTLLVAGNVGHEAAHSLRRGLVAVGGSTGDYPATNMIAGSLLVFGGCGAHPGAGMRRGTLAILGDPSPALLPTFRAGNGYCAPLFMRLYLTWLASRGVPRASQALDSRYRIFHGDGLAGGRGEILVRL